MSKYRAEPFFTGHPFAAWDMYRHYWHSLLGATMLCDRIWSNARLATLCRALPGLGVIEKGLVACHQGKIVFAGASADAPAGLAATQTTNCEGRWITPGLIDCHTHLVYGGDRAHEFEMRIKGASYEEIARAGGGIVATMKATRASSPAELMRQALTRLDSLLAEGVTSVEVKSGYGLSREHECKQLRVARALATERRVNVATTLLAAHALPPEFTGNADGYIDEVCTAIIPAAAAEQLADAVDAFCEGIGFSAAQCARVFEAATAYGLPIKIHAEQLSNQHGAALAAEHRALSADHLEHLDEAGAAALARAGTVAVLLPGAFYFTRETRLPPLALLRSLHVPLALATDCNPGTSPMTSILLAMNMGAVLFRMTVEECIVGVTRTAAKALGREHRVGTLEAGKDCDLAIWNIERPAELVYRMGSNPLHARIWRGQ